MSSQARRYLSSHRVLLFLGPLLLPQLAVSQARGTVHATVTDSYGAAITAAALSVLGTQISARTDNNGQAFLTVPVGIQILSVRRIGCAVTQQSVAVPAAGSVYVEITMSCPTEDKIVTDVPLSQLIGLVDLGTDVSGTASCADDQLIQGSGSLIAPGNATSTEAGGSACHLAALILANDRAPFFSNDPAKFPWTSSLGDVVSLTLPSAKLHLPMRIIVSDPSLSASDESIIEGRIRAIHLPILSDMLNSSTAGIEVTDPSGGAPQIVADPSLHSLLDLGCSNAAIIRGNATLYSPERINVYYIKDVKDEIGGLKAGYTCVTSDALDMIFVDDDQNTPNTLAHELGHALGLNRPDWGHSEEFIGFLVNSAGEKLNIMAQGLPAAAQYLSVGQLMRMHLSSDSWMNRISTSDGLSFRARQAPGTTPLVLSCGCPETVGTSDCTPENTDIPRIGGTPTSSSAIKACDVAPSVTTVDLCTTGASSTATITAQFSQGTTPTNRGSRMWVSLAPSIVSVADQSVVWPPNHDMKAQVTAVAVGAGVVRAYVDGSFAPITVTVHAPGAAPC